MTKYISGALWLARYSNKLIMNDTHVVFGLVLGEMDTSITWEQLRWHLNGICSGWASREPSALYKPRQFLIVFTTLFLDPIVRKLAHSPHSLLVYLRLVLILFYCRHLVLHSCIFYLPFSRKKYVFNSNFCQACYVFFFFNIIFLDLFTLMILCKNYIALYPSSS
jgi:hypothetical protein